MDSAPWKCFKLGATKFVGNRISMTVHEWSFRTPECGIEEVPKDSLVFFGPDTLAEAESKGFTACQHCLPYNQKRK